MEGGSGAASSSAGTYDYVFKCIIIGDTGTGKSCCLHRFVEGKFKSGPPKHTIGVEFGSRVITLGGKRIKMQIWDTAGQERFRSVTRSYYRGAFGALVVYDVTKKTTFEHVENWLSDARTLAHDDVCCILCGNKCDLEEPREVPLLEGTRLAQENQAMFLETSALTGENIDEVFYKCARSILTKIENGDLDPYENEPGASVRRGEEDQGCMC